MRFTVRYKINQYDVCDENHKLVSMIQKGVIPGKCLVVYDADKKRQYQVVRDCGEIVIKTEKGESTHCVLEYPVDESGHVVQKAYTRPPMAERTRMNTQLGALVICQTEKRNFSVYLNDRKVGEMPHMLSISKEMSFSEEIPRNICGLIFAVGFLMLHDDDIEIV